MTVGSPQYEQITFENTSGETAPAYAILQVDGASDEGDGRTSVSVIKPDGSGDLYYPNRQFAVSDTKFGKCMNTYPAWVSCSGGTPAVGEEWGPVSGSWDIQGKGSGFIIVGGYDATLGIVLVEKVVISMVEGYLDGALAASTGTGANETTATLSKWRISGTTWEDSTKNITVTNRDDSLSGASGDYCIAIKLNGEWRPIWVECS